jgi:ABC-type transport system involved in multi-copper enzyme maturation permease subunit
VALIIKTVQELMFKLLLEKELRESFGSTKVVISFGVSAVLILLTFYVGIRDYELSLAHYDAAKRENLGKMSGQADWGMVRDHTIYLPPSLLASLVSGVANDVGRSITMSGRGELSAYGSRFGDEPALATFRFLDLTFLFQAVLSLLAIVFAYNAVNGEKENGTLQLTFANAVPRGAYILAKLSGAFLSLCLPLLLPILIGFIMIATLSAPLSGDEWIRLTLIIVVGFLYLGVFLSLSVCASIYTRRSSHSFVILLALWIGCVGILPRAAVMLAGRAVDVPNLDAMATEKNKLRLQLWTESQKRLTTFKPAKLDSPEVMMQAFNAFMSKENEIRETKLAEFAARLNEDRQNRESLRETVALNIARVSPPVSFSLATTTLAGTSLAMKSYFWQSAKAYQKTFAEFMAKKNGNMGGMIIRVTNDAAAPVKPIDVTELPVFYHTVPSLSETLPSTLVDIALLLLFNSFFVAVAYWRFNRYDLR